MKKIAALAIALLLPFVSATAGEARPYEMPRTEVVPIEDSNTGRQYELYIKLPEQYAEDASKNYPVIYMTDADMQMALLSGTTAFLMPEAILVGITGQKDKNGNIVPGSRGRDFSLIKYDHVERPTGEAGNYLSFLGRDVIPYVEGNFRANPEKRAYWGYSSAAEFGAYAVLAKPETFKYYVLGSPALDKLSMKYLDELEAESASEQAATGQNGPNINVFVSMAEHDRPGRMELAEELVTVFGRRGNSGLSVTGLEVIGNSNHMTAVPETFLRSIKWLAAHTAE
ncbi:alpha/beta hydrolase [Kordiimonas sp.]|uniref:alpha/beta hydrolase n=1 Tax=Kordiimonas sp. TaxID=1970157 RepID=UPI003A904D68